MCCSYGYEPGTIEDVVLMADQVLPGVERFCAGRIGPSDPAVILKADQKSPRLCAGVMPWGFFSFDKKLLINARAETVQEKKMFAESVRHRRCAVPASHFYEWDRDKVKNTFSLPDGEPLYMAGFYDLFDNTDRFIILTTQANGSMRPVHDRMPLILPKALVRDWILDDSCVKDLLAKKPPELTRKAEYEQLRLF